MSRDTIHRILFQIYNRRGLGHLMRGSNLAREIHRIDPRVDIRFHTRTEPPAGLRDPKIHYCVEADGSKMSGWSDQLRTFLPDVVVYDTMLPRETAGELTELPTRRVYLMRRCRREKQEAIFRHPFLKHVDTILIPHAREEFGYDVPEPLAGKSTFAGPIVRGPSPRAVSGLRAKYEITEESFVLTSTAGGGGFEHETVAFLGIVVEAHRHLACARPSLRHIVIPGPKYPRTVPPRDGMTIVAAEPDMVDLLALSDIVISMGGYNTVTELRLTRTPAIFVPSPRTNDDQAERVHRLARAGLAHVVEGLDPEEAARRIAAICSSDKALSTMRSRYGQDRLLVGNRVAAERILDLARG